MKQLSISDNDFWWLACNRCAKASSALTWEKIKKCALKLCNKNLISTVFSALLLILIWSSYFHSRLIWHLVKRTDSNDRAARLFLSLSWWTTSHVFALRGEKDRKEEETVDTKCGYSHIVSCWGRMKQGYWVLFWKMCVRDGGGRWLLHKLSSCSVCIAWPTVHRHTWNVGQTPSSLFFLFSLHSVCILLFLLSWIPQHWGGFLHKNVCCWLSVLPCLGLKINQWMQ